jgi:hypothetical protein
MTHAATYHTAEGFTLTGTATQTATHGWVFTSDDDDFTLTYADAASLTLTAEETA